MRGAPSTHDSSRWTTSNLARFLRTFLSSTVTAGQLLSRRRGKDFLLIAHPMRWSRSLLVRPKAWIPTKPFQLEKPS